MRLRRPRVGAFFSTHRFRPTLIPTLAMVALTAIALALGNWQRHRADEKRTAAALASEAGLLPAVDLSAAAVDADSLAYRTVRAVGEYDAPHSVLIDNKVHNGLPGYEVVTSFRLAPGERYVLVDRGWVPQGPTRQTLPPVTTPAGRVEISGRAVVPSKRYLELKRDADTGPLRQNLDIERIAASSGLSLLPVVVEQIDPVTPPDSLVREWPVPDFGIERHVSYMVQWYSLAALAVALWLALNWKPRIGSDAAVS